MALRRRRERPLAIPLAAGLALMVAGLLVGNWDFFYPRYLYAALPAFGVLAGAVLGARARPPAAVAGTALLAGLWGHLATVTPFVP